MIYFIKEKKLINPKVKIGYTNRSAEERLRELQTSSAIDLKIVCVIQDNNYYGFTERSLQEKFNKYKSRREWYKYSDEIKNFIKFMNNDGFYLSARPIIFGSSTGHVKNERIYDSTIGQEYIRGGQYTIKESQIKKGDRFLIISVDILSDDISFPNMQKSKGYVNHNLFAKFEYNFHGGKEGPVVVEIKKVI